MAPPTNIEPFIITTTQTVKNFTVTCKGINLFQDATFAVDSFDENQNLVSRRIIQITHEEYILWNNDDTYIIDLMAQKLGYIIEPSTTSTATVVPEEPSF